MSDPGTSPPAGGATTTAPKGITPASTPGGRGGFLSDLIVELGFADAAAVEQAVTAARVPGRTVSRVLVGCKGPAGARAFFARLQDAMVKVSRDRPVSAALDYGICALGDAATPEQALKLAIGNIGAAESSAPPTAGAIAEGGATP